MFGTREEHLGSVQLAGYVIGPLLVRLKDPDKRLKKKRQRQARYLANKACRPMLKKDFV